MDESRSSAARLHKLPAHDVNIRSSNNNTTTKHHHLTTMVLDNDSPEDGPPTGPDYYNNTQKSIVEADQNWTSNPDRYLPLPADLPHISFMTQKFIVQAMQGRWSSMERLVKRPLTKDEVDFTAYWHARYLRIRQWGVPLGASIGLYRAWETHSTYKFPFFTPPKIDLEYFPTPRSPWIKDSNARYLWHGIRYGCYLGVGVYLGRSALAIYASYVCASGISSDSRAKDILQAMRKEREKLIERLNDPNVRVDRNSPVKSDSNTYRPNGNVPDQPAPEPYQPEQNDYGSTGDVPYQPEPYQPASYKPPPAVPQMNRNNGQSTTSTDFFDDASPTGGFGAQPEDASQTSGGSAWDRLRQQAASGKPSPEPNSWANAKLPQTKTANEHAFTSHEAKLEAERARERREFDRLVEQERKGGNSGAGGTRPW